MATAPRIHWLKVAMTAAVIAASPSLSHAATIQILNLEDVDFGTVTPSTTGLQQRVRACVNTTPAGPFQIVGLGSGAAGAFTIASGSGQEIAYFVRIGNRGNQDIAPGVPLTGLRAREPRADGSCQPPFTFITVEIDTATLQVAPGGRYQGVLQLTVAPE